MSKVYLARGHGLKPDGGFDPGAVGKDSAGNLWTEQKVADIAVPVIAKRLKEAGVTVRDEGTSDPNYIGSTKAANDWDADLTVSVHCDWSGGLDFHVLYWHTSSNGKALASAIEKEVKVNGNVPTAGIRGRDDLYLLKKTTMPAVIVELGRIGSSTIDSKQEIQRLAAVVADGILDHLGIEPPEPTPPPDPSDPEERPWRYPQAAANLLEAGIYSTSTTPGANVNTDNLSAYLDRTMRWVKRVPTSGVTEDEVRAIVREAIRKHAANPDAHHE